MLCFRNPPRQDDNLQLISARTLTTMSCEDAAADIVWHLCRMQLTVEDSSKLPMLLGLATPFWLLSEF